MNLEQLKQQAAAILAIQPSSDGYQHRTFECRSGGAPYNTIGVPEVHRSRQYRYDTVSNGSAYQGSVTIECKETGCIDSNGRKIFITPCNTTFVYAYRPGSASSFDSGSIISPKLL